MAARDPSRRTPRYTPLLAWAVVSALALVAFTLEIDDGGRSPLPQDATLVVPAQK
jgi:hypothetical protein